VGLEESNIAFGVNSDVQMISLIKVVTIYRGIAQESDSYIQFVHYLLGGSLK